MADEIARHGAGASLFSDWWAYKFEVFDAIPYAGALLRERGVLTSFNSDSDELARRLNFEAAKAVKYGGVPPTDALAFVTSNPAKQLGIFDRTGSLEPGKDADFVLWSGDPLSTSSLVQETWIDGKKYFDRPADLARRAALEAERTQLVGRAKRLLDAEKRKAREKAAEEALDPKEPEAPSSVGPSTAAPSPRPPAPVDRRPFRCGPPRSRKKKPRTLLHPLRLRGPRDEISNFRISNFEFGALS